MALLFFLCFNGNGNRERMPIPVWMTDHGTKIETTRTESEAQLRPVKGSKCESALKGSLLLPFTKFPWPSVLAAPNPAFGLGSLPSS